MIEALKKKLREEVEKLRFELNVTLPSELGGPVGRGALRQARPPAPRKARASSSTPQPRAHANARQPDTATDKKLRITVFGPWRSSRFPKGSWVAAKPRK